MPKTLSVEFLQAASGVLKTLGHPIRLKIIEFLEYDERTVGAIQRHLDMQQPVVSQHLRLMKKRGILDYRRDGTKLYYYLANDFIRKILICVSDMQAKILSGEWNVDLSMVENQKEEE